MSVNVYIFREGFLITHGCIYRMRIWELKDVEGRSN